MVGAFLRVLNLVGTVTIADSSAVIVKSNLGTPGLYSNVVKINITREYNQGDPFPTENRTVYITVQETGDGIILATDQ